MIRQGILFKGRRGYGVESIVECILCCKEKVEEDDVLCYDCRIDESDDR